MPKRIQLTRKKGWRMPANAKKVDRSTRWGNPFGARQDYVAFTPLGLPVALVHLNTSPSIDFALDLFAAYLLARLENDPQFLEPLRGRDLACWCRRDAKCHADILLRLANQ